MADDTLTAAELATITGKKRAPAQAVALVRMGVPFTFFGHAVSVARAVATAHALLPQQAQQRPAGGIDFSRVR